MPHILFLMSDTGGGHRAACRAIEAALAARYPGLFTTELVDVWKDYMPFPLNTAPTTYSRWVNTSPGSYSAQFWVADRMFRSRTASSLYCSQLYPNMKRLYEQHPADIVVCAHSVFVRPAVHALRHVRPDRPYLTVITDYAWPTVLWYDARADRTLVPTRPAYERGLALGVPPERLKLTGAPVHPKFTDLKLTKREARAELGWDPDATIVLIVGGGDGMGPLLATARAVDSRRVNCELILIAGRNEALKASLERNTWKHRTRIYGFVNNVQVFMRAADLLITKAGPATITEAATVGLPMVLSGAIQHQETPNAKYVVEQGAGVYSPGPKRVAGSVEALLANGGKELHRLAEGVRKLAEPDSVWKIAAEIRSYA